MESKANTELEYVQMGNKFIGDETVGGMSFVFAKISTLSLLASQ